MLANRKVWEGVQLGVIAGMFIAAAVRWSSVPARLPVHWNAAGEVDRYGGRFEGLLLVPIITIALYLLLLFIPRIDPARANYESFRGPYLVIRVTMVVYMAFIYAITNLSFENEENIAVDQFIVGAVAVLFVLIGAMMGKFRPNYFAGIRTPWTLTSKKSWVKTHRLGGWVFILSRIATGIGAIFGGIAAFITMFAVLIPGIVLLFVYSYVVWKDDPDRVAAQDVRPGSNGAAG